MKIIRKPNINSRIADPIKPKRVAAHRLKLKMPLGAGILRNPEKSIYNKIYNRITQKLFA
jgi:hypothetical protein